MSETVLNTHVTLILTAESSTNGQFTDGENGMQRRQIHILYRRQEAEQPLNAGGVILERGDLGTDLRKANGTLNATLGSGVRHVESCVAFHHPGVC